MQIDDLRIYKIACQLRDELHLKIKQVPRYWTSKSSDQAFRSSSSVSAIVKEGYARRFRRRDFVHFLVMALGSSDETQDHVEALYSDGIFNGDDKEHFFKKYKDLSIRIVNYINYQRKKFSLE